MAQELLEKTDADGADSTAMPKILKYVGLLLAVLVVALLLACNQALASMVASFAPTAYAWIFAALVLIEASAFFWLCRGLFARQEHLAFDVTDSEGLERLKTELTNRLLENNRIKKAKKDNPLFNSESVEDCLGLLNKKADEEIQRTATGVFLATALSQNGRIDTIIVFFGLCRMVWKISSIYNQRPHPSEVLRLYRAVTTSIFLAYSIDKLDIPTEVTASLGHLLSAVAPATVTGAIPFVGTALQGFTKSALDGAANCYLALRTGIITRNAYSYILTTNKRPTRGDVFKEAGAMLLDICQDSVKILIKAVQSTTVGVGTGIKSKVEEFAKGSADGVVKMASGVADVASSTSQVVMDGVVKIASGVADVALSTNQTVKDGMKKLGQASRRKK